MRVLADDRSFSTELLTGVYSACTHKKTSNVSSGYYYKLENPQRRAFYMYKKNISNKKPLYRNIWRIKN